MCYCCTILVIGDRVTSPTWMQSQFITLISRMDHLGGIAHVFCTFLMLGDRVPRSTWVRGLSLSIYRAIFSHKIITGLMLTKTIVTMTTVISLLFPKTLRALLKIFRQLLMRCIFNHMQTLSSQSERELGLELTHSTTDIHRSIT